MDYCEESLQEIDITSFLQTLCGHIREFQESHGDGGVRVHSSTPSTFTIGEAEEDRLAKRGPMASSSRYYWDLQSCYPFQMFEILAAFYL